jgi:P-type Ca2+ transporter type 2C
MSVIPPSPETLVPVANWHARTADDAAADLDVDPASGLSADEARRRLHDLGPNRLAEPPQRPAWLRFVDQFRSGIVYILLGAAVLAAVVGDAKDPIVIGVVLVLNAVLGYVQEARAAGALDALRRMLTTTTRIRRDGVVLEVASADLVPGDVVLLEAGDRVPADGRLVLGAALAVDESSLTGESMPVEKVAAVVVGDDVPLAEQRNRLFMNTTLVRGRAELIVTETGMATEMGRVAAMLTSADPGPTPLQRQLDRLGTRLAVVAVVAVAVVFVLRLLQGDALGEAALSAVALAVAAIPEGLPAVVTVTLAVGVGFLARRQAIVKRLHSVETLGATSVICSDKTGTLTVNQMTVTDLVVGDTTVTFSGEGYRTEGTLTVAGGGPPPSCTAVLGPAVLANDAAVRDGTLVGDPTEGALVVAAAKAGLDVDDLRARFPRLAEVPFDSAAKYMATFHQIGDEVAVYLKGAPEFVMERCRSWRDEREAVHPLTEAGRAHRWDLIDGLGRRGLRVLAVASRSIAISAIDPDDDLGADIARWAGDLTLEGFIAMIDPPRPEAARAIALCRAATIDVKMITGDNPVTASSIAAQLGLEGRVVTGRDLDAMTDDDLVCQIEGIGVCARVAPEHKVRVVQALKANGHVVAMTGDGVNDAAALRNADIGVAMGITGTEVTKEAGDMVLADDNFATIVDAVERGRSIYANIVKFVRFQLTTNLGAISTILGASILGLPMPLTALQVLWVNIIADGPPAMTLGVDPPDADAMRQPPRDPSSQILTTRRVLPMILAGLVMAIGTLGVFVWSDDRYGADVAGTMAFTTFVLFQMVNVFNARRESGSALSRYSLTNNKLWLAVGAVVAFQALAVKWGPLQSVFDTVTLEFGQWMLCVAVAMSVLVVEELRKLTLRLPVRAVNRLAPEEQSVPAPAPAPVAGMPPPPPSGREPWSR